MNLPSYPKSERESNLTFFIETVIPLLESKNYNVRLLNPPSHQYRITFKKRTIDFYPKGGRLCFIDYSEWITIEKNENVFHRIETYLDMQI